jgi:hypothetical protein
METEWVSGAERRYAVSLREVVPRPTSASGFTVSTRRAVIEAPWIGSPGAPLFVHSGQLIARLRLSGAAHLHLVALQDLGYIACAQTILMSPLPR